MIGPFAGMRFVYSSHHSEWCPKVLGTYEIELAGVVEEICTRQYSRVINIGAGEGYYSVGIAMKCPRTKVTSFESSPICRHLLNQLASKNSVDSRIESLGKCTARRLYDILRQQPSNSTLLIVDVEGQELELLAPLSIPNLLGIDILVESHDCLRPGCAQELRARFHQSHRIHEIASRERTTADLPAEADSALTRIESVAVMSEQRPGTMVWLWMQSNRSGLGNQNEIPHVSDGQMMSNIR
ncbi:MAG: hypothetical protein H6818_03295 [Phycisphaerales bacterium]|nr:hypothetical protein [Phycisphaerales bacterium]MCB9864318.1 hypothetical protein [Phycisphaerales bacterium]